jgi:Domain of unknown function (DUF4407)
MRALQRFLRSWGGVDNLLLQRCPHHERQRYTSIGMLVLLTGTFAAISSGYAFFTVFERLSVAVVLGSLWGFMVLNIDRVMLTTFPKCATFLRQLLHAAPRLVLALLIGITIAHPITLRLFEREILERIAEETDAERVKKTNEKDKSIERLHNEIQQSKQGLPEWVEVEQRKKERAEAVDEGKRCEIDLLKDKQNYLCEADGTCGTLIKKCGPVCEEKKKTYHETATRCESRQLQIQQATGLLTQSEQKLSQATKDLDASLRGREDIIVHDYQQAIKRLDSPATPSFLKRSETLGRLADDRKKAAITLWFVSALFILVEVIPVFMTIITPADSADRLAVAVREAFVDRIPALALELSDTPRPSRSSRGAESIEATAMIQKPESDMAVIRLEETEPHGKGTLRGYILVVTLTVAFTTGILVVRHNLTEAIESGTLFVAIATPALLLWRRKETA